MGNYSTKNDNSSDAKISRICFSVYLFILTLFLIACILLWPDIWDNSFYAYSGLASFKNPISLVFGALGAILRICSESPMCTYSRELPTTTICSWDYLVPIIGAVFGFLSFLMLHVIVDRFVMSSYKLDPIYISLIALSAGFHSKQILKRFCRKKYAAVKLLK